MAALETYKALMAKIAKDHDLTIFEEHEFINEFSIGELPLFKLLYATDEKTRNNRLVVSFHLDISVVDAIQWYVKITNFFSDTRLTESYYKDDRGETFLGQDAEIIKRYKTEQEVITGWLSDETDDEDARDFANSKIHGRMREKNKAFADLGDAVREFNLMAKGDDDEYH